MINNSNFKSNWKKIYLNLALWGLVSSSVIASALPAAAEVISGKIEKYDSQKQQATIDLGKEDGVDKYDRGKIELTSLDSPNVKFIGANIVVISVEQSSAIVSVREAPGVQVPVTVGAEVTLDTESGLARREEEAKLLAAQRAEEDRRQQQLAQARAEQVRLQKEQEQALAAEARRQQQLAQKKAQAEQARQQQELDKVRAQQAEKAQRQQELAQEKVRAEQTQARQSQVEETPRQQELELGQLEAEQIEPEKSEQVNASVPQKIEDQELKPKNPNLEEAQAWWQRSLPNDAENSSIADLPLDYVQAYVAARKKPSSQTYYDFAQILIEYEIPEQALTWLQETGFRFPTTQAVSNYYQAVALVDSGELDKGQNLIETSGIPKGYLKDELKSYLYTHKGQWDRVFTLSKNRKSAVTYNNYLIGLFCTKPPALNRDSSLSPPSCPFGNSLAAQPEDQENIETLRTISQQAISLYPDDPYILNTLGFLALQAEDYDRAFKYYQNLAKVLDKYDTTPPELQLLKANAISYLNNFNQNYEFLTETSQDLELLRSQQGDLSSAIAITGAGNILSTLTSGLSPAGIVGIIGSIVRLGESRREAKRIIAERNSLLDQMRVTFAKDIELIPARPNLEAEPLLKISSSQIDKQLRLYDNFWSTAKDENKNSE